MTQNALSLTDAVQLAATHLRSGNYPHATEVCTQILQVSPNNADALHFLGLMAANQGRAADALSFLQRAVDSRPDDFELHNNLGNLQKVLGRLDLAQQCFLRAIELNPDCFPAHFNLALTLAAMNSHDHAVLSFRRAIELEPEVPEAHYNLGLTLRQLGDLSGAVNCFQQTVALRPEHIEAHVSIGVCLAEAGQLDDAIQLYRAAIQKMPAYAPLYNNLGVALTAQGNYSDARAAFWQALQVAPESVETRNNLGVVERLLGNQDEALNSFKQAIEANPDYFEAYRNLAQCLADRGQYEQAVLAFRQALQINPAYYEAKLELAVCYASMGDGKQAVQTFSDAQSMRPSSVVPLWGATLAALPNFFISEDEIAQARAKYERGLDELESQVKLDTPDAIADAASAVALLLPFFLTYQPHNNKDLQAKHGRLVGKIMQAQYPQWTTPLAMPVLKEGEHIRVGVVSRHFSDHSDWKVLTGGILQGLDNKIFDVCAYSTGGIADVVTAEVRKDVRAFVQGLSFEQMADRISQDKLHVLLFPEVGMDPITYKIASLRLAPIQCSAWARPETSGVPTVDYFLSSDLMEPEAAAAHYTEKLVRLPNLFSYYVPQQVEPDTSRLAELGLRPDSVRYACVQSLFKYLPQHDSVFVRIAQSVSNAQFVFVAKPADVAEKLKSRLSKAFQVAGLDASKHLTFLPLLSHREFVGLLRESHVFLDSIGYSGCLTTLEAVEAGLPIVTTDGEFMRGRQSKSMLDVIGITETIAADLDAYVDIAVRLGQDSALRSSITEQINEKGFWLYRDYEAMNGLQDWLKNVVKS